MLVALCFALLAPARLKLPNRAFKFAQVVVGAGIGTFLQGAALSGLGWRWVALALVGAATLGITTAGGLLLSRVTALDRPTAALGMVAGGASGMVAMAEELGGDERLVAFMQYTRVIAVTALTTLAIPIAFGANASGGAETVSLGPLGEPSGWALVLIAGAIGVALGLVLRLPAPALLGPLILTAVLPLSGLLPADVEVPAVVRDLAFGLIGVRVGLGFDLQALRQIAGTAHSIAVAIAALIGICFLLGWALALTADVSLLDGYLATTPGGIFAVLPIASGSDANTTFVLAAQSLRLIVMVLVAPFAVRLMVGFSNLPEERIEAAPAALEAVETRDTSIDDNNGDDRRPC
jgi:membrane AbrB-like protein